MKFEIDFNRETGPEYDKILEEIGAKLESTGSNKYPPFERYMIDLSDFKELENLLLKVKERTGRDYYAIVNYDPVIIFLDDDY